MTAPSQTPQRSPAGYSTDPPYGPLADFGLQNPFMYQVQYDDFMGTYLTGGNWASVISGTGSTVASAAGDGGVILLTNGSTANLSAGIKGGQNNFFLPPAAFSGTGLTATLFPSKKVFFLARMAVVTVAGFSFTAGLVPSSYTTGNPTDGIVIQGVAGLATMNLNAYSGSSLLWSVPFPTSLLVGGANAVVGNNLWFDIGFYMDRLQNVYGMLGFPLVGWVPQSAWTGVNNVNAQPVPKAKVCAYQTGVSGAWTPTAVGLTPAIVTFGSTLTSELDFVLAAKER